METIYSIIQWLPWLVGGSGISLAVLAVGAALGLPSFLRIAETLLRIAEPAGVAAVEGVVWLLKAFARAIGVCLHNTETFLVIGVAAIAGGYYLYDISPPAREAKAQIVELKKELAVIKKSRPPRAAAPKSEAQPVPDHSFIEPLGWTR